MKKPSKTILDTSVIVDLFAGNPSAVGAIDGKQTLLLPVIVIGELYSGAMRSTRREDNLARLEQFVESCLVLDCTTETAKFYGVVIEELAKKGNPIPTNDCWIAALALQHEAEVLTRDSHFQKVRGLQADFLS